MNIHELQTPAILVELDTLERNIHTYQKLCSTYGKQLWPMIKTHKSTEIASMQLKAGATGFLCGTLDECEAMATLGVASIMHAYPVAGEANLGRVVRLAKRLEKTGRMIVRVDSMDNARPLSVAAMAAGATVHCTIIIDSGLHRFGVAPADAPALAAGIRQLGGLHFAGISTHPGHVYAARTGREVAAYAADEQKAVAEALAALRAAGHTCELVSSGSTPTFPLSVGDPHIGCFHPGNYVFNDSIQLSIDIAREKDCALTVLATVIARPALDRIMVDAGAKCLGLDQGAHGNDSVQGYGTVRHHTGCTVVSLSEEVGKLHVPPACTLQVGDVVEIIPNHACSSCNLTNDLVGHRKGVVERLLHVDIRGNSTVRAV